MIFYELENSVTETATSITFRNSQIFKVKDEMKNHSDFWRSNGTGTIYKVEILEDADGNVSITRTKVYSK